MTKRFTRRPPGGRIDTLKKGVYILPNFLTSLSLFAGFFSIVSTMEGQYLRAAWAIIVAALFDGLDGRIARMTHTTSRFGVEYDSLSDLVSFGVAPAVLAYGWCLSQYGRWGWLAAFLYVACGGVRLARFNVRSGHSSNRYFLGLPIPAAAGVIATAVMFCTHVGFSDKQVLSVFLLLIMYAMALLMVSTIHYTSFKKLDLQGRKPFSAVLALLLLICVVASEPQILLFTIAVLYVFLGPIGYLAYLNAKRRAWRARHERIEENNDGKEPHR